MKLFGKLLFSVFSNAIAILATAYFVAGFVFDGTFVDLIITAGVLTAINVFVRPVLKLLLGPLIILTLGLFLIIITALTLYLLDKLTAAITIQGYLPLLVATLVCGVVNGVIHFAAKAKK